ncbi:MAG: alpha/beta hydrolase [Pseudomonadota bacterium]
MTSNVLSAIIRYMKKKPTLDSLGVQKYRTFLDTSAAMFKPDPAVLQEPVRIQAGTGTIEGLWLRPVSETAKRAILYLHGGGYVAGSIASHRDLAARIALAARTDVLVINYRLAPENPFPAGLDDALTAFQWLSAQGYVPTSIGIAGDSAGGGLALALLLKIRQHGLTMPGAAALISPWADLNCTGRSHQINRDKDPMLNQDLLESAARMYTNPSRYSDPLVSPLYGDLAGLCPVLIQAGTHEILQDDALALKNRAEKAGVTVRADIWEGMFHVWHYFARYLPQARQAISELGAFMDERLRAAGPGD